MSLRLFSRADAGVSGSAGGAAGLEPSTRPVRRQFRNEWKYYLSLWDADALRARIAAAVPHDEHAPEGGYAIRSLYFDDYWDSAYHNKIDGVQHRTKWRVRIYNCSDAVIKLERKVKDGAYIYKQSARLSREEFERIIDGDYAFLLANPQNLCREFYVACVSQIMRPKVIVDYEREPFVFDAGTVRITFDELGAALEQELGVMGQREFLQLNPEDAAALRGQLLGFELASWEEAYQPYIAQDDDLEWSVKVLSDTQGFSSKGCGAWPYYLPFLFEELQRFGVANMWVRGH